MAAKAIEFFTKIGGPKSVVSQSVDNGAVRMKILVKRHELKQVLEQVANQIGDKNAIPVNPQLISRPQTASKSLEQRLKDMKRMRLLRSSNKRITKGDCQSYWRPALQSIPEAAVLSN